MGQLLSEPVVDKKTSRHSSNFFEVGVSSMQGWRVAMEDAHSIFLVMPEDEAPPAAYFGVFDGHGGTKVSDYVSKNLHKYILKQKDYQVGKIKAALETAFLELDSKMSRDREICEEMSGTTAIVVLIKNNTLYCANVGDSRAIAFENGNIIPLSTDHKPNAPIEQNRITAAGGWVEGDRVNGTLALSRALGDFQFKGDGTRTPEKQVVSPYPDVISRSLNKGWEFLVLACDGIWEVLSNDEVGTFVKERLSMGLEPEVICEQLIDKCLAPTSDACGPGCDNMTVIIVTFKWGGDSQRVN